MFTPIPLRPACPAAHVRSLPFLRLSPFPFSLRRLQNGSAGAPIPNPVSRSAQDAQAQGGQSERCGSLSRCVFHVLLHPTPMLVLRLRGGDADKILVSPVFPCSRTHHTRRGYAQIHRCTCLGRSPRLLPFPPLRRLGSEGRGAHVYSWRSQTKTHRKTRT